MLKIVKNTIGLDDNSSAAFSFNRIANVLKVEGDIEGYFLNKERAIYFNNHFPNILVYINMMMAKLKEYDKKDLTCHLAEYLGNYHIGL